MNVEQLAETAQSIVADGKGLLAADESTGTIKKRFDQINVESTERTRRDYRHILFTTPDVSQFISGVILYDETIRQDGPDGSPLVETIEKAGMIPGIKVDNGAKPLAPGGGEKVTEGLDGLRERFKAYYELGARFAKWRGVYSIGGGLPSRQCIRANAHALARYAALAQEANITPVVEPEVLMDGSHDIDACREATEAVLREVFAELAEQQIVLEGILLKPNMVLSGKDCPRQADANEVARETIRCFKRVVPAAVPGVVFLSGGQSDEQATVNLDAMNKIKDAEGAPWALSFSYGRALQQAALKAWSGNDDNAESARKAFYERAKATSAAALGRYAA
ncbi:class I fructose-bisphosphate aldolase [Ferruginivarius sediminum]|uniref:Fructose-bisphosphate aldolase n=1 Tax=Ferruginivarius sediminum TaxID=2661937 RepID=A0A369T950_9PROT|nr:class I fructose-bisphosphate aldolase [Ferruginivarius sediminum]RDD61851.1 fructose-bisphosphate aldolase class I [Ferruginivarius sediminum]